MVEKQGLKLNKTVVRIAVLLILVLTAGSVLVILTGGDLYNISSHFGNDYRVYWSATRLLMTGGNPYDSAQLLTLELANGSSGNALLLFWNPPWTLAFLIPFAVTPFPASNLVWLVFSILITLICGALLWREFAPKGDKRYALGMLAAIAYLPTLQTLKIGQITPLLLAGITVFIISVRNKRVFFAGLALALLFMKPHITFLFLAGAGWWMIRERRWKALVGAVLGFGTTCAIVALLSPAIVSQYIHAEAGLPLNLRTATLGTWLRTLFGINLYWLQFLPSVIGVILLLVWVFRHKETWNWSRSLPVLLLSSVIFAAYGWSYDTMILIPVVIVLVSRVRILPSRERIILISGYVLTQIVILVLNQVSLDGAVYYWYPPALAGLYLWQLQMARFTPQSQVNEGAA
jgi:hypothetical protein